MATGAAAIEAYLRAKDENRPFLMAQAFAEDATLTTTVNSGAISFPPAAHGREAITSVLVRDFARTYENVRTLCLASPPGPGVGEFSCRWLVGMSSRSDGTIRVGCGRYDWSFQPRAPRLVTRLSIVIDAMQVLAPADLAAITGWLFRLPYPWCPLEAAFAQAPARNDLVALRRLAHAD